jgi:hypothetical protein
LLWLKLNRDVQRRLYASALHLHFEWFLGSFNHAVDLLQLRRVNYARGNDFLILTLDHDKLDN